VLCGVGHLQSTGIDLLFGGRGFVLLTLIVGEVGLGCLEQGAAQRPLDFTLPHREVSKAILLLARQQTVDWRRRVVIATIPCCQQLLVPFISDALFDAPVFAGGNLSRKRPPTVSITQQNNKVRPRRSALRTVHFIQADFHCLLVETCFFAHAPSQVDGLKTTAVLRAQIAQPGKDVFLNGVPLLLQVAEGRADEDSKCSSCLCQGVLL